MKRFFKLLLKFFILIFLVSLFSFCLVYFSPLSPINYNIDQVTRGSLSSEQLKKIELYWQTGIPFFKRYFSWFFNFLHGNFGISLIYHKPVMDVIKEKLSYSFILLLFSWLFSGIFGFFLGVISAIKKECFIGKTIYFYGIFFNSIPSFWLGLILLIIFSVNLHILPVGMTTPIGSYGNIPFFIKFKHALLPLTTLILINSPVILFFTRDKMIKILNSNFILLAKIRKETITRIIFIHCFKNIILPILTLQFISISEIISNSILIETVFSYPGIGQTAVSAGLSGDISLLLAITIFSSIIIFLGNFITDFLHTLIDPRISKRW